MTLNLSLDELLTTTRSVRKRLDFEKPVSRELLLECLELALQALLRFWRTNAANAYSLIVSNGSGGGNFGAGSILTLTADPAPSQSTRPAAGSP